MTTVMDVRSLATRATAAYQAPPQTLRNHAEGRADSPRIGLGADQLSISEQAKARLEAELEADDSRDGQLEHEQLTQDEQAEVRELRARDREVRAHELAHKGAAGGLAVGGPSYSYQTGPDGKRYAVGGEVSIQLREGRTPEETVRLMRRAQSAALAPAQPSSQDRAVAAEAARIASEAQRAIGEDDDSPTPGERPGESVDALA